MQSIAPAEKAGKGSCGIVPLPRAKRLTGREATGTCLSLLSGSNSVVECNLAKVEVAGSNPVSRSKTPFLISRAGGIFVYCL